MKAIKTIKPFDVTIPTLGWLVIAWIEAWLIQPDGDAAGQPYRLTREQRNFILWHYALDANGRFVYRRSVLRRAKGWGKSPFLAALCIVELVGPVAFAGWAESVRYNGRTVRVPRGKARPNAWVILAGTAEKQTKNTFDAVRGMISARLATAYRMDVQKVAIFTADGRKMESITANAGSQEGARPTFAVMDEVHHWTASNGGKALAKVVRRNLAKVKGRSVVTTNAHAPSQDTVARDYFEAHLSQAEGRTRRKDLLYDCVEAPPIDLSDEAALRAALKCAYGDSWWVDFEDILSEIWSPDTPVEDSCRFYLNQIVDNPDSWLTAEEWLNNHRPDLAPLRFSVPGDWRKGETVTLGFDGSRTDDSTALVAVRVSDGAPFLLGLWEKPPGADGIGWEVPREEVRGKVANAFATLDVVAFSGDVAEWQTDIDDWRDTYAERLLIKATPKHAVAWDMRTHQAETVRAIEALHRAFADRAVPHNDDPRMKRHCLNARRRPGKHGVGFGKESRESKNKVDILAAILLARMALTALLASGALAKRATVGTLVGWGRPRRQPKTRSSLLDSLT